MNHALLGSKILHSMQAYKREREEFKVNWPRTHSVLRNNKKPGDVQYIIFPNKKRKIIWDFFIGALILESVIIVPLRLGFSVDAKGLAIVFDVLVDICFGLDMVLTFFTAYEKDNVMIMEHKRICKNYLKTWFAIDFMSTFPFDKIIPLLLEGISPGALRSIKLVRALRLFRLLKLFRVARLNRKIKDAKIDESIHPVVYDLLGLFFWIFIMSHVLCCGFFYFSECDESEGDWLSCGKPDLTSKYILSMYWTVATILSVGYGDVYLISNSGRLFSIFVIFLGAIIFGFLVSTVQTSARNWDKQETERLNRLSQVREYIYEKKVTGALRKEMSNHFEYYYTNKANFSEEAIVLEMPIMLRQYALENTKTPLMNLNFFKLASLDIIMEVVPHLHPFITKKGEYIYREGEFCVDMIFVISGLVEAFKRKYASGERGNFLVGKTHVVISNSLLFIFKCPLLYRCPSGLYETGSEFGMGRAINCRTVSWASFRSCDKCDLMWLSNTSIRQLMECNNTIRKMFESESQREDELIEIIEKRVSSEFEFQDQKVYNSRSIKSSFRVPNNVIHNNVSIINIRAATRIIQIVDRIDEEIEEPVQTFKTLIVAGKNINGQDNIVHRQETTAEMWQRWIINPRCPYKLYFDLVIAVMVIASCMTIPYRMGFGITATLEWSIFDGITEFYFCLDMVFAFFTALEYKDGTLDTSLKKISVSYLRTWFIIDFFSAVPLYRLASGGSSVGVLVRLLKALKLGRLFRLFKVFKFARIMKLLEISNHEFIPNEFIAIENSFGLLFKLLCMLCFTTHIISCIFSWISLNNEGPSWASEAEDADGSLKRYVAALYWTYTTMATVGMLIISLLLLS